MWRQRFRSSQNAGKRQKARRSHSARKGRKLGDDTASDEEDSRIRCIHHHHKIDLHYHPGPMPAATPAIHLALQILARHLRPAKVSFASVHSLAVICSR